ncbi:MAG: DUF5715 family protein [Bryobacterales bacterium]
MTLIRTIIAICVFALVPSGMVAATLRANSQSQVIQNEQADTDRLTRMEDQQMIARFSRLQLLVPVENKTRDFYIHNIPEERRYLRPWAKLFLERLGRQYRSKFGQSLRITSLVRTEDHQRKLQGRNPNAAAPDGEKRSAHLTGACLDISKKGMNRSQMRWVREVLSSLKEKGHLYAVEEFTIPNFHIMVHRDYPEYVELLTGVSDD